VLAEAGRHVGRRRTVNSSTVALGFLHPRNQARFAFRLASQDEQEGVATWKLDFVGDRRYLPSDVRPEHGAALGERRRFSGTRRPPALGV